MRRVLILSLVVVVGLSMVACAGREDSGVITLRLAENQPANNPVSQGMELFAKLVEEKTDGSVKVEVYLNAQLGSETETIDQVRAGTLDLARVNTSALQSTVDAFGVYTLPFIFTSTEQKYNVLDGEIGAGLNQILEDQYNMKNLCYLEAGSRNFYTTSRPIHSVSDMRGLKVRVQPSNVAMRMVELLGAAATPMDYGEVYQGLQTGVIDAAENDFVSYYTSGHYEVAPYFTLDGHMAPPALLIVSMNTWNKLSAEQQAAVQEAANEAAVWQRQAMADYQNESRDAVEAAGCQVIDVDVQEFQDAVADIYDLYPQYAEYIAAIRAAI